jgi:hypothetical protein
MLSREPVGKLFHAQVVECALFATLNFLKSLMAKKAKSPFSNIPCRIV